MNTISGVRRAVAYEIERQTEVLRGGGTLQQETRRWDDASGQTFLMRSKESAHDYRYFPDPDLLPVETGVFMEEVRALRPELPAEKRERFVRQYGVTEYDAGVLADDLALAAYFEAAATGRAKSRRASRIGSSTTCSARSPPPRRRSTECPIPPAALDELVTLIEAGAISSTQGEGGFRGDVCHREGRRARWWRRRG